MLVIGFGSWFGKRCRAMRLDVETLREQVATFKQASGSSRVGTDDPDVAFRKVLDCW